MKVKAYLHLNNIEMLLNSLCVSLSLEEEDDDEESAEMDMNNSSARGYSDEDDESGLSKKEVGLLIRVISICKAVIDLGITSELFYLIPSRLLAEEPQAQEQKEEE